MKILEVHPLNERLHFTLCFSDINLPKRYLILLGDGSSHFSRARIYRHLIFAS